LVDRIASWLLKGPLAFLIVVLCVLQLATWIPHFLTWPFFVDHDVFATLAFGWESGLLPYRDLRANNFPGTIYLFWVVGKVCGWGRTTPIFALDSAFVIAFGVAMLLWSRRRFHRLLPGAIGYASFLTYYLSLDYRLVFQRDWHGPLFMVLGLMMVDGWPTRTGRIGSAICAAIAFSIRPQVVLLIPALIYRVARGAIGEVGTPRDAARAVAGWTALAGCCTALAFLPVWLDGTWADFLGGVRLAAYGGAYNQFTPSQMLISIIIQCMDLNYVLIPLSILMVSRNSVPNSTASIESWLIALAGAWFYKPLSPVAWPYLTHPYQIVLAVNVGILVQVLLEAEMGRPSVRLGVVFLALLGAGVTLRPKYCSVGESRRALDDLRRGIIPEEPPMGYIAPGADPGQESYPWQDYRDVLSYLRRATSPGTRVANLLRVAPALTGPSARIPAIPAESLAWLVVKPDDEAAFVSALEGAGPDTVVVWAPSEEQRDDRLRLAAAIRHLAPVVHRYYEPEAHFERIEVWRRKGRLPR
jgi:hypothetical protein